MKQLFVVALFAACMALPAQETRREVSHATGNPAIDSKPNSPDVPDVFAVSGHLERIVVLRFKFGTDLLAGLEKMVAQEKIKNAVILSAFGSVRGYQVHMVSNRDMPRKTFVRQESNGAGRHHRHERHGDERPHSSAHHAGQWGQGLRRPSGAGDDCFHLRRRDSGRSRRLNRHEPLRRFKLSIAAAYAGDSVPGSPNGSLSLSVTSAIAASRSANSSVQHFSGARQLQLPAGTAGVFMRASDPSSNKSCAGTIAISATLASTARISGHAGRSATGPTRASTAVALRFAGGVPPSLRRVVVVRAGVGHCVPRELLRQVHVRALVAESELQHLHARHSQLQPQ